MTVRIPFIRPTMPDAAVLAADFASIAAANWYTNFGPQEQAFRRAISEYLGPPLEVATVSNATVGPMEPWLHCCRKVTEPPTSPLLLSRSPQVRGAIMARIPAGPYTIRFCNRLVLPANSRRRGRARSHPPDEYLRHRRSRDIGEEKAQASNPWSSIGRRVRITVSIGRIARFAETARSSFTQPSFAIGGWRGRHAKDGSCRPCA